MNENKIKISAAQHVLRFHFLRSLCVLVAPFNLMPISSASTFLVLCKIHYSASSVTRFFLFFIRTSMKPSYYTGEGNLWKAFFVPLWLKTWANFPSAFASFDKRNKSLRKLRSSPLDKSFIFLQVTSAKERKTFFIAIEKSLFNFQHHKINIPKKFLHFSSNLS